MNLTEAPECGKDAACADAFILLTEGKN